MNLPFSYEDRHPERTIGTGYAATNEEPSLIRTLIRPFNRGLGIAASGDVAFFSLLPKCRESLVLVDHSYSSLRVFCVKALLLTTLGPVRTKELFAALPGDRSANEELMAAIAAVQGVLPLHLQLQSIKARGGYDLLPGSSYELRREWGLADIAPLKAAAKNLHKIKLIHGDLQDAADRAPFDFLYLSNALEHVGRGGPLSPHKLATILEKGAPICWVEATGSHTNNTVARTTWDAKRRTLGFRTSWYYNLSHNAPPATQVAKAAAPGR